MKTAQEILKEYTGHAHGLMHASTYEAMEAYANQSKWATVEDRLPKSKVLVLLENGAIFTGDYSSFSERWFVSGKKEHPNNRVTHWQPLPERP